jgi:hypothetical protein
MAEQVVKVAKIGKNALSLDPNDFIFHSSYNSFKIILEGTKVVTLSASTNNQTFSQAHGLKFIPLVDAFAKRTGASQVFKPNATDVELWGAKLGMTGDVKFNYISSDATNINFNFDNAKGSTVEVSIRYFCLERIS